MKGEAHEINLTIHRYMNSLQARNLKATTRAGWKTALNSFYFWSNQNGYSEMGQFSLHDIERFKADLADKQGVHSCSYKVSTIRLYLRVVKLFFKWATHHGIIADNPAESIRYPLKEHHLPSQIICATKVEQILQNIEGDTEIDYTIRCALEILWSTGIRRNELLQLSLEDIDWDNGIVLIRKGKGAQSRLVPIGSRALDWIRIYISKVRSNRTEIHNSGPILINKRGRAYASNTFASLFKTYFKEHDLSKYITPKAFRHAYATTLLNRGVSIVHIKNLLGHGNLSSTQIYTKVSMRQLKQALKDSHPDRFLEAYDAEKSKTNSSKP